MIHLDLRPQFLIVFCNEDSYSGLLRAESFEGRSLYCRSGCERSPQQPLGDDEGIPAREWTSLRGGGRVILYLDDADPSKESENPSFTSSVLLCQIHPLRRTQPEPVLELPKRRPESSQRRRKLIHVRVVGGEQITSAAPVPAHPSAVPKARC